MGCGYLLSILFCLLKCLFSDIYHLMSLKSAFKKDYFNWKIIIIQYFWWFCAIYQHESAIGTHVSRPSWTHLPSHSILLGCPRALALGALLHEWMLYWSSVLHTVSYIFQCYSLKTSHPWLLPLKKSNRIYHCSQSEWDVQNYIHGRFLMKT